MSIFSFNYLSNFTFKCLNTFPNDFLWTSVALFHNVFFQEYQDKLSFGINVVAGFPRFKYLMYSYLDYLVISAMAPPIEVVSCLSTFQRYA